MESLPGGTSSRSGGGNVSGTHDISALSKSSDTAIDLLQSEIIRDLQMSEELVAENKQDLMSASEDAPIIRLGNSILGLAIKKGASDIHIEPMEKDVVIRYRIDGVLQTVQNLPKKVQLG
jgi:type IV pilus assembly protein PilB